MSPRALVSALAAVAAVLGTLGTSCTASVQDLGTPVGEVDRSAPSPVAGEDERCPPHPTEAASCDGAPMRCMYFDAARGCRLSCVCAVGDRWSCLEGGCGMLTVESCAPGGSCGPTTACQTADRVCACGAEARFHCRTRDDASAVGHAPLP